VPVAACTRQRLPDTRGITGYRSCYGPTAKGPHGRGRRRSSLPRARLAGGVATPAWTGQSPAGERQKHDAELAAAHGQQEAAGVEAGQATNQSSIGSGTRAGEPGGKRPRVGTRARRGRKVSGAVGTRARKGKGGKRGRSQREEGQQSARRRGGQTGPDRVSKIGREDQAGSAETAAREASGNRPQEGREAIGPRGRGHGRERAADTAAGGGGRHTGLRGADTAARG
jgi:hypothetical protein